MVDGSRIQRSHHRRDHRRGVALHREVLVSNMKQSDAVMAIETAIAALKDERDANIAEITGEYQARIDAHLQAIALLGGKVNGSKPRTKPSAKPERKPRAKRTVDPKIAERRAQVLNYIRNVSADGPVTVADVADYMDIGKPAASLALRQLVESGAITVSGKGRATRYSAVVAKADEAAG